MTVTDVDGNVYHTVKIGSQVWMAENLRTVRYCNGDSIPDVPDSLEWMNLTTGAYCNNIGSGNVPAAYAWCSFTINISSRLTSNGGVRKYEGLSIRCIKD